jgi:beta-N-acetylhexosaminidase
VKTKIGQSLIIGLRGTKLLPEEKAFILENNIGGVNLFSRNIESPQQLHALCSDVHNLRFSMIDKAPLFVGIDMEGGRVHRLPPPFTQWPAARVLGKYGNTTLAFRVATSMGAEMAAVGINLDFSPCVDILTNPNNSVIGDRSISDDPEIVTRIASAIVRGYIKTGIIPCAKHFPGHGNTLIDSHEDLPIEETTLATLMERELIPFKKCFRARLDLVMTAHIKFSAIDNEWPVTLSSRFLQEIIRNDLGYRRLVITDDLDMGALRKHYSPAEIAVRALQAGANILLYCNDPDSPAIAINAIESAIADGTLNKSIIEHNHREVLGLKADKLKSWKLTEFSEVAKIVGHPEHRDLVLAIESGDLPRDLTT